MTSWRKNKTVRWILVLGLLAVLGELIFLRGDKAPIYEFITVERGDIVQEVSVTGRVKPTAEVSLAFERSGKIGATYVKVGDKVGKDQLLVAQVASDLSAQLSQASAGVASAQASLIQYQAALEREKIKLGELKRGSRPEEITIAEQTLQDAATNLANVKSKAAVDLANIYDGVSDVLNDVYTKADDAVNKQTDALFTNDTGASPKLSFATLNTQVTNDVEWQRILAGASLKQLQAITGLTDEALAAAKKELIVIRNFLNKTNDALRDALSLGQTTIDAYRAAINTGLSNVNAALASVNGQQQSIASQEAINQNSLATAQEKYNNATNQLALTQAGATGEQIAAQAAQVRQAQANLAAQAAQVRQAQASAANASAQLQKTSIRAPFAGTVTNQEARVGEIITPGAALVSLIAEDRFEIEADLPEVDIAKIALQDEAGVTLDAYGDDAQFTAVVITVDPAATIIEGVPTYTVRLQFTAEDERIKPGMTANVIIFADKRTNVLAVPARAIIEDKGQKSVRLLRGKDQKQIAEETAVTTGLRGSDGRVEILSGLNEGDRVITGEKKN